MLRIARTTDAAELASLATELGYPSTAADVERRLPPLLEDPEHLIIVATDSDDRAIGWLHAVVRRQPELDAFVQIAGLVVAETHRGTGIGTRLLEHAERWASQSGIHTVRVHSNATRELAHRFYERAGYSSAKTSRLFTKTLRKD